MSHDEITGTVQYPWHFDMSRTLDEITTKAAAGERLSDADAQALFLTHDVLALGVAADAARVRRHADRVTYVRVADVSLDAESRMTWPPATGEIRAMGQLQDVDRALSRVRELVAAAGATSVSVFSLSDLAAAAAALQIPLLRLLERINQAGVKLLAETLLDQLPDPAAALRTVAQSGMQPARVAIDRVPAGGMLPLYRQVRALQDELGNIHAFAPLPRRLSSAHPTTGYEDVKQVAIARLLLDNIDTIQVDWALYGPKLAQVALTFGADDLDNVSASDDAPAGPRRAPLAEVRRNITAASRVPVERNGFFAER